MQTAKGSYHNLAALADGGGHNADVSPSPLSGGHAKLRASRLSVEAGEAQRAQR